MPSSPSSPLDGGRAKDTTEPKIERREDLIFAASKESTGDLPQSSPPEKQNGEVLS